MAKPLEDRIEMTLDDVIGVDWRGKGRGAGGATSGRGKKARTVTRRLVPKGTAIVKRRVKGKSKGKGKVSVVKGSGRGLVKKSLFTKTRRLVTPRSGKGIGKGKRKGSKDRSKSAGKGSGQDYSAGKGSRKGGQKGSQKGSQKGKQKDSLRQGFSLWRGASSVKRKGKGKSKGEGKQRKGSGKAVLSNWRKGKGKGETGRSKGKGKGKGRGVAVYRVRREGGIVKRGTPNGNSNGRVLRNGSSLKGAKGMGRALAIAASSSAKGSSKGTWAPRQREEVRGRGDVEYAEERLSSEDKKMMKKITIVAQLDKVPKPTPAMQGLDLGSSRSSSAERAGSLSRRFSANFNR